MDTEGTRYTTGMTERGMRDRERTLLESLRDEAASWTPEDVVRLANALSQGPAYTRSPIGDLRRSATRHANARRDVAVEALRRLGQDTASYRREVKAAVARFQRGGPPWSYPATRTPRVNHEELAKYRVAPDGLAEWEREVL